MLRGGVDLCYQNRKVLSCSRKSVQWHMRLVWFLIDVFFFFHHCFYFGENEPVQNERRKSSESTWKTGL